MPTMENWLDPSIIPAMIVIGQRTNLRNSDDWPTLLERVVGRL